MVKVVLVLIALLVKEQGQQKATGKNAQTKGVDKPDKFISAETHANYTCQQRKWQTKAHQGFIVDKKRFEAVHLVIDYFYEYSQIWL